MDDFEMQYLMMRRRYVNTGIKLAELLHLPESAERETELRRVRRQLEANAQLLYQALVDFQTTRRGPHDGTIH